MTCSRADVNSFLELIRIQRREEKLVVHGQEEKAMTFKGSRLPLIIATASDLPQEGRKHSKRLCTACKAASQGAYLRQLHAILVFTIIRRPSLRISQFVMIRPANQFPVFHDALTEEGCAAGIAHA